MKKQLLLAALFIAVTVLPLAAQRRAALVPADTSIVLNEIMYSPPVGANAMTDEYIEVYNTGIVAIDLRNWKFNAGTALTLNDSSNSGVGATILPSGGYALILGNGYYTGATRYYNSRAPVGTLFLRASGALGLLNDGEAVTLSNPADDVTSTHTYTGGGANGRSREKIVPSRNDAASNWQQTLIADGTPGAKNSVSPRDLDAQNLRVRFAPSDSVAVGTAVTISSVIKNNGLLALTAFSVEFYDDANNDGVLSAPERFSTQTFNGSVLRNDSTTLTAPLATPNAATRRIGTIVQLSGDELRANDTARAVLGVVAPVVNNPLDTHLVLNEILYAPTSPKPEFIEIFNKSATDSIKINGLRVGDRTASAQAIEDGGADIYLRAQQYAVIFGRSDSATSRNFFIPSDARKLFSRSASLELNNSGDTVFVVNAAGTELARFRYTGSETTGGRSLEKIIPSRLDTSTNYEVSIGDSVATPGRRNSVTPFERDLALRVNPLFFTPPATPINLSYTIINRGSETFGNGTVVRLFNDANNNSLPEPAEQINSATLAQNVPTKDSLVSAFNFTPSSLDTARFIFTLSNAQDQSALNDTARTKLGISDTSIVLNEILYRPPSGVNSGNNEFLELFNTSATKSVDLRNWKVAGSATTPLVLTDSGATGSGQTTLAPQSYAVILPIGYFSDTTRLYRDLIPTGALVLRASGSLSLNDTGDNLIIITAGGDTAARFLYPDKAAQGFSLEKITSNRTDDTTNYAASLIQRGTPGAQNSVAPKNIDVQNLRLQLSPPDSAALNTIVTVNSVVRNRGLSPAAPFSVSFYSDANLNGALEPSEIFSTQNFGGTLAPNDSTTFTATFTAAPAGTRTIATVVSLTGDEFRQNDTLRTGYKIFVPSVSNPADTNLVLNEIMYAPASPKPEFIELYNKSATDSIKINGLRVGDRSSSNTAIDAGSADRYLKPLQYAVVLARSDSAAGVANYAIPSGALILIKTNSLGLNNDGDTVFVINAAGTQLATYSYKATAATNGRSLEKIIPNRTDDTTNYASSEDATLSTPGRRNSVTPFNRDLAIKTNATVFTAPNTPVSLNYTVTNRGSETFGNGTVVRLFNDINNNSVPEPGEQINSLTLSANLAPKDSLASTFSFTPNSLDTVRFIFALSNAQDQSALNDTARTKLAISDTSIVLNEIMYDPPTGANTTADEFIELYNASSTKSVDLRNWRIADAKGFVSLTDSSGTGTGQTVLAPNGYAVILGSSYFTGAARYYKDIIPAGALVLRASASLSLANTIDTVAVVSASGDTVAKYIYTGDDDNKGLSLEKIISNRIDLTSNYAPSFVQRGTPGQRNSVTPFPRDLALRVNPIFFTPPATPASLTYTLINRGLETFGNGTVVRLFNDLNNNSVPEPTEQLNSATLTQNLIAKDSLVGAFSFTPNSLDTVRFIFTLSNAQDQSALNDTARTKLGISDTNIVLNEIMYDTPAGADANDNEFIELFNTSETKTIDLKNWRISQLGGSVTLTDSSGIGLGQTRLAPKGYAVILPSGYFLNNTLLYQDLIPVGALILRASGTLSLNGDLDGDKVSVISADGDTVAKYAYKGESKNKGFSLEKIIPNRLDLPSNYAPSFVQRGTPGRRNSANPRDRDLALRVPTQFSTPPNTAASLPIAVVNRGLLTFGNGAVVKLFVDQNRNGVAEPAEEQAAQILTTNLAPGDSSRRAFTFTPTSRDTVRLIFTLAVAQDEDTTTNFSKSLLLTGAPRQSIVVNEILYAPIQSSTDFKQDQPDYVELYNRSDAPVDLRGWYLTNLPNERGEFDRYTFATDTARSYVLNSREYAVVSPDTSRLRDTTRLIRFYKYLQGSSVKIFFITSRSTFSNSEDGLVQLVDNTGGIVDSVRYFDSWNSPLISETRGKSLEKINPDFASNDRRSWTTAVDRDYGGTPGKQNSVFATSLVGNGSSISISPNPFSPDADGRDDNAVIAFTLPGVDNRLRVKIYDVKGRLVRTVANAERATQQGSVVWDGLDDNRQSLRVGIYVVFLEALDANAAVVQTARTTVVLARYMSR